MDHVDRSAVSNILEAAGLVSESQYIDPQLTGTANEGMLRMYNIDVSGEEFLIKVEVIKLD
tara:strand:- start:134 stop:316 length:183 start_codon:yes stop_codon:yes gene_type:complete